MSATSIDGLTWTQGSLPVSGRWGGVAYGNGIFVAVMSGGINGSGSTNIIATSTDGLSWVQRSLPVTAWWRNIIYANNQFIIVDQQYVAKSSDGINWTVSEIGGRNRDANVFPSVAFGSGTFVLIDNSGYAAKSTNNGSTWSTVSLPNNTVTWSSITYGNGYFVAVSGNHVAAPDQYSNVAAISSDGTNWTQITLPSIRYWSFVTYGNGKFVALDGSGTLANKSAVSLNGVNWTEESMPIGTYWSSAVYGNSRFVAVSTGWPGLVPMNAAAYKLY
jgi:hypothetical protein